ncbi:MAG: PAS domain-containing protein [Flavobacteriales bacterium]|nr:PAS domain-containing protein [Flavobacteriales bacterium]
MSKPLRVLLLEDSVTDVELIRNELNNGEWSYELTHVSNRAAFEKALKHDWDIILSDYSLPGYSGLMAFRSMTERGQKVPFIIVTGVLTDAQAAEIAEIGIDDYLIKDRLSRLALTITKLLGHRLTEIELREQEEVHRIAADRHRTIMEQSRDMVTVVSPEGIYVYVSAACNPLLGYRPNEMLGRLGYDFIPVEQLEYIGGEHVRVLETKQSLLLPHKMVRKDGTLISVESSISPVVGETGELTEIIIITRDVEERERAADRLEHARHLLNEAQHLAQVANWNLNMETYDLYWSDSLRDMLGVEPDFKPDFEFFKMAIHPDDRPWVVEQMNQVEHYGKELKAQFRLIGKGGVERIVKARNYIEQDKSGTTVRIYGVMQDVTDLSRTQTELQETLENLELKVAARTQELERSNREVIDGMRYAKHLQDAALPGLKTFERYFSEAFIYYRPLNIIGGDFYWCYRSRKQTMVACGDCTGHGVPGAFMSLIGTDLLRHVVIDQDWRFPSLILELMDVELENRLSKSSDETMGDGMDMAFCTVDNKEQKIQFSGAMSSIVLIGKEGSRVFKGNRYSLGAYISSADKSFETAEIPFQEGEMLYMFSDGFQDQLGGPRTKRYMFKNLLLLLERIHEMSVSEQRQEIHSEFEKWRGQNDQVDDVLVMGLRL